MKTEHNFNRTWTFCAKKTEGEKSFSDSLVSLPFFHNISTMPEGSFTAVWFPEEKDNGCTAYIEFSQISADTEIFCNGKHILSHYASSTSFIAPVTLEAKAGEPYEIRVDVKPKDRSDGMFCFANAKVITVGSSHFDVTDKGKGIFVRTEIVDGTGIIDIEALVTRPNNYDVVSYTVSDMNGQELLGATTKPTAPSMTLRLSSPERWDGQNGAYLYTLKAQLVRDTGVLDEIVTTFGFREYELSSDGFFWLNGFRLPLNGIKLNDLAAVKSDLNNLIELDCNALISSLLPSKTDLLSFTDRQGLLFWYLLPFSGDRERDMSVLREFLMFNRNSPSLTFVVCGKNADEEYYSEASGLVKELAPDVLCTVMRDIDVAVDSIPDNAPLTVLSIPAKDSSEAYINFNGRFRELQEKYPERLFAVFAESPVKTLVSPEAYLEKQISLWQAFSRQKNIAAYFPGILTDGKEPSSLRGLISSGRTELYDAFWFCKAQFSSEGFIKIADPGEYETQAKTIDIKCITNRTNLRILVNGKDKKYKAERLSDGIYVFRNLRLRRDENIIEVSADDECDSVAIFRI